MPLNMYTFGMYVPSVLMHTIMLSHSLLSTFVNLTTLIPLFALILSVEFDPPTWIPISSTFQIWEVGYS